MPNPHNPDSVERMQSVERSKVLIFDIETDGRYEVEEIPENWFRHDARLTDPVKIDANLKQQAQDKAALSPITGQVVAIGYSDGNHDWACFGKEHDLLSGWQEACHSVVCRGGRIYSFNGTDFDIPFLMLRCIANGLKLRPSLGGFWRSKWQPAEAFMDLQSMALFGRRDREGYSLDKVCRSLGLQGKSGSGKDFAELLRTDRAAAEAYLLNDIACTRSLAERFM